MKRIIFSLMTLVAVLSVSGVGSFAYFSDTETSTGNTFTAGTLNLQIGSSNPGWLDDPDVPVLISSGYWDSEIDSLINNMKPGDEGTITVPIRNDGSVDGEAKLRLVNLVDYENGCNEPECVAEGGTWSATEGCTACVSCGTEQGELSQYLYVVIKYGEPGGYALITSGMLDELAGDVIELGDLTANAVENVVMDFSIAYDVGNIIQSDSVVFDITFELIQPEP